MQRDSNMAKYKRYYVLVLQSAYLLLIVNLNLIVPVNGQYRTRSRNHSPSLPSSTSPYFDHIPEHPEHHTVGNHYDDHLHDDEPTNHQQQKAINPCHPSYHRMIQNQPQRSYNHRFGSTGQREHALCDRDLTPGWYRFKSLAGNTIPTSCPGVNYCGTRAPVWMKGSIPTLDEGIVKATGCVSVQGKCCTTQIQMLVRNCSDFIVYHLQPTPACPSAYCAGYEVRCPPGLTSDTGYTPCHFPVDLLETKVSYGFTKDNSQLQFFCDVTLGGHVVPESVALEIEWIVDDETVQTETFTLLEQHKGVLKEEKWNIGQVLQCRAKAKHTTINTFTSDILSPPFNTGLLLVSQLTLTANEGGEPVFIEFQPQIPITCPKKEKPKKKKNKKKEEEAAEEEEEECCVTFDISTRGPQNPPRCALGNQFDLVVLGSCTYKICADEWNATHRVPVWAVNDGLVGGNSNSPESFSTVFVDIRTDEKGNPPRWAEIALPVQEIQIAHDDVEERCRVDGYMTTFDGLTYLNDLEGIFVLYKHETLPYEVQIHVRKCNQRSLCNCAVAVKFGEVMLAIDICTTGKLKFWSYTADGNYIEPSKIQHLPQIIRIDDGRSFQISFPSGTRVNLGPNLSFVTIQASHPDLEHTSGLCGSFDRDKDNDFSTFKGTSVCPTNQNVSGCPDFVKTWRLSTEQSLFLGSFTNLNSGSGQDDEDGPLSPGHCSCSSLKKTKEIDLRPKTKSGRYPSNPYEDFQPEEAQEEEENKEAAKCHTSQCVDPRGVDVTHQILELVLDEDFTADDLQEFGKIAATSAAEIHPVFYSPNGLGQNPGVSQALRRKDPKEWTDDDADVICRGIIEGMPATKLCRDIAQINVEYHTKACKNEVMHSKTAIWTMDALERLRWDCRDQVYHNLTIWEPQLGRQYGTPPPSIISSLCLNNCTGAGVCESGQCHCHKGFDGADCSVNINAPPTITHLNNGGVCDIRQKPCSEVLVWGDRLADHSNIKCHFEVYRSASVKSVPVLAETLTTNGKLFTYQSIICDVPDLAIHDAKITSFYIPGEGLDKTRTLMRVSVTYGSDSPPSTALDYTIFDSLCWGCEDGPLKCEARPTQSCNVLTEPFSSDDPFQNPDTSFNTPALSSLNGGFSHSNNPLQYSPTSSGIGPPGFSPDPPPLIPYGHPGHHSYPNPNPNYNNPQYPQTTPLYSTSINPNQQPPHQQPPQFQFHPQLSNPCFHPSDTGPCKSDNLRYFYDTAVRKCRPFIYGGCQGNTNNFLSELDCQNACVTPATDQKLGPAPGPAPAVAPIPTNIAATLSSGHGHHLKQNQNQNQPSEPASSALVETLSHEDDEEEGDSNEGEGSDSNSGEVRIGFSVPEKCMIGNNPGPCQEELVRYYYDSIMRRCRPFIYGGCGGNENNFTAKSLCAAECERWSGSSGLASNSSQVQ